MAETSTAAAQKPAPTIPDILTDMAKLMARLNQHSVFGEAGLNISEWAFLRAADANPELGSGSLAKRLGITPQRGTQLVAALVDRGLVNTTPSKDDTRKRIIAVTPDGKKKLRGMSEALDRLFHDALGDAPNILVNLSRQTRKLLNAVHPPAPKETAKVMAKTQVRAPEIVRL